LGTALAGLLLVLSPAKGQPAAQLLPTAPVVAVQPSRVADLVLLGRGFDAGLRSGMICRITRGSTAVGEILLVELRPGCSAALITSLAAHQSIRPGDTATIKLLKS
jgi:hypothetical protein